METDLYKQIKSTLDLMQMMFHG